MSSTKQYEDDEVLAFNDIHPKAAVHVLVIPKKHIARLADATKEDQEILGKCQLIAGEVAKKLGVGKAFRLILNNGERAGQEVLHMHYHMMGDKLGGGN